MARRSRILGDFKLRGTLRKIHKEIDNELRPAMQQVADLVLQDMQRLIPRDTGEAAQALETFVSKSGLDAQVGIRGKRRQREFYYLRFIEFGTKGISGQKRAGGRNRRDSIKSDGAHWFGKFPNIPARPAHPFMGPAMDMNRDEIVTIIRESIAATLRRAAEGSP